MFKESLIVILLVGSFFALPILFNHVSPWAAFAMGIVIILVVIQLINNILTKNKQKQ
jgi:putative flippase GtrA